MKRNSFGFCFSFLYPIFTLCLCASVVAGLAGCASLKSIPVRLYHAKFTVEKQGMASARVLDSGDREIRVLWKDKAVSAAELDAMTRAKSFRREPTGWLFPSGAGH